MITTNEHYRINYRTNNLRDSHSSTISVIRRRGRQMNTITYDTEEEAIKTVIKRWNTRIPKERGGANE